MSMFCSGRARRRSGVEVVALSDTKRRLLSNCPTEYRVGGIDVVAPAHDRKQK